MRYGSLFSGIGGLDLGFDRAGYEPVFQVELDKYATKVLERHWPDVPRYTDITEVDSDDLGSVDVLVGGFPCQDISMAGRRAGLAGSRSGLFYEFARIAADLRPVWLCIENVPGLLSSGGRRDMGAVVGTLGELGYGVAWRVLDSQYFGLAQRRKRLFLVGHLGEPWSAPGEVLLEPGSVGGDPPARRQAQSHPAPGRGAGTSGHSGKDVVPALTSKMSKGTGGPSGDEAQNLVLMGTLNSGGAAGGFRTEPGEHLVPQRQVRRELEGQQVFAVHNGDNTCVSEDIALSVTGSKGNPGSITDVGLVRRLTPLECERLQGFPDEWTQGISNTRRYKTLGNAVSVPVANWIAQRIAGVNETTRSK